MSMESKIIENTIAELEESVSVPVFEFADRDTETVGAQIVVQCDQAGAAARDKDGRVYEKTFPLILHVVVHSQYRRDNKTAHHDLVAICDNFLEGLTIGRVEDWLDGGGDCTGIAEQDSQYNFTDTFDDFARAAEIYIIPTQEI